MSSSPKMVDSKSVLKPIEANSVSSTQKIPDEFGNS